MYRHLLPILSALALLGCSQSDFGEFPTPEELPTPEGPGDPAWGDANISCNNSDDCTPTETCENNVCMPSRCDNGPFESRSPIGANYIFFDDKEILVADQELVQGSYWIDGYMPANTEITYKTGGSWSAGSSPIIDLAGGNVLGIRPDAAIAAIQGSSSIVIRHDSGDSTLSIDFQPIAVAAGDIDQDSIAEVVAIGAGGQFAICQADEGTCSSGQIDGAAEGFDVTVGDVDGDHYEEPVFLVRKGKNTELVAHNPNHEDSGEPKWTGGASEDYTAISAGKVDDSGADKVIGLIDGGYLGWVDDQLDTIEFSGASIKVIGEVDVDAETKDIELSDLDMDGRDEIAVLYGDREVQVRRAVSASNHSIITTRTLSVTEAPSRLGLADLDGDSPTARQLGEPELVSGGMVPVAVMQFPPFSKTFSKDVAYLFVGRSDNTGEDFSDSMSVRYGVGVGFDAKIPNVVRGGFMARFGQEWSERVTTGERYTVGSRFIMRPDIELHGNDFSVVMLSSGCFHSYGYEIDDPKGALAKEFDGSNMAMLVPVGGNITVWSSKRYNALARHLGSLPEIETRVRVGDPSSYPRSPETTKGEPVNDDQMLFPETPNLTVSDVGVVGFWLSRADYDINDKSTSIDMSGYGNVGVGPVTVNVDTGLNNSRSHSINIGSDVLFGGGVPAVPDNPDTPEDEHAAHGFSYSPKVHSETYTDANGNQAGYYVLTFTVGESE